MIQYINNSLIRKYFPCVCFFVLFSVFEFFSTTIYAQEIPKALIENDSLFIFNFKPKSSDFIGNFGGNTERLNRLVGLIKENKSNITSGKMLIRVFGFSTSISAPEQNKTMMRQRSLHVKSWQISQAGVLDKHFKTINQAKDFYGMGDVVVLSLFPIDIDNLISAPKEPVVEIKTDTIVEKIEQEVIRKTIDTLTNLPASKLEVADIKVKDDSAKVELDAPIIVKEKECPLRLRANLLHWALLNIDAGLEWKVTNQFSVIVNAHWTHWKWSDNYRQFRTKRINPEIRYYFSENNRWYAGLGFHAGQYNFKFSDTGSQGDFIGVGLTSGYLLKLGKRLDLDFNLGLGYTKIDYEKYIRENFGFVRTVEGLEKNFWGLTQAGVILVWRPFGN